MPNFIRMFVLCLCAIAAGCATMPTPDNAPDAYYQPMQQGSGGRGADCLPPPPPSVVANLKQVTANTLIEKAEFLGPGDRLLLAVSGDPDMLSGTYIVESNGRLIVDGTVSVMAAGRTRYDVERDLRGQLLANGLIRDIGGNVHLAITESAGVQVSVSGAVFQQGLVRVGERQSAARAATVSNPASGDFNAGRSLAIALRVAGGIRPDAQASSVYLIREDRYAVIDVTPAFTGGVPADPKLAAGDRIIVPSLGCFQEEYVRPSSVTPPGIRVYLSNLSRPATGNAPSGIGKDTTSFPYGARMLEGVVSANCVGGSAFTAARKVVLISRNPTNNRSVAIQSKVEDLVRSADRDAVNPYLMPGDAIACYDSSAMSLLDVVDVIGRVVGPLTIANGLNP